MRRTYRFSWFSRLILVLFLRCECACDVSSGVRELEPDKCHSAKEGEDEERHAVVQTLSFLFRFSRFEKMRGINLELKTRLRVRANCANVKTVRLGIATESDAPLVDSRSESYR